MVQYELECLPIRQVPGIPPNPSLQIIWIRTILKHFLVVIGFQKSGIALLQMPDHLRTGIADVCKYPHAEISAGHHKAVRMYGVVQFEKRFYDQIAYAHFFT